ncbi:hypothetical protein RC1_2718 [Rhodospirillum centenum SW]|uniref:Uncharacterized protein n=1 Tax=Rhodospirillum centenum (strain ATCC 51521 / SW) TaxID=414684 RepID=B6IUB3_RHOCS|nr:hypothetical protein RC1_2718 [Rhodospirillum centenum SW]
MPGGDTPDSRRSPGPQPGGDASQDRQSERIRRQSDRIREMERLMKAAAAFARGRPPR